MTILIASDHAGLELKEKLKVYLAELGHSAKDFGALSYDENDDYPDFILPLAEEIAKDPENSKGIVLGGSGQGEAMAANRINGCRAVVYYGLSAEALAKADGSDKIIVLSRQHNNANILSLGARFLNEDEAKAAVKLWLETPFSGEERHIRRLQKLESGK